MGIPAHAPCAAGSDTPPECNPLHARAVTIRDAVVAALAVADWTGTSLVSHGPPPVNLPQCDQLAVWLGALKRDPLVRNHMSRPLATYVVRLSVGCWPAPFVQGAETHLPSVEDQQRAAEWSYAWATVVYDALIALQGDCSSGTFNVSPLTPGEPSGGCATWTSTVTWAF